MRSYGLEVVVAMRGAGGGVSEVRVVAHEVEVVARDVGAGVLGVKWTWRWEYTKRYRT